METLSRTWRIMGASWRVLKKDTELLLFPVLSAMSAALVMGSFLLPLFSKGGIQYLMHAHEYRPLVYVWGFLFYVANYFVTIFFNAAIIACALARMTGRNPTVRFGLRAAWRRFPQIFLWTLATSTVGLILRAIEERVGLVGRIVVSLLGMAWSVTSFLVVPVLVHRGKGPIAAYQESVALLKRSWGEQITGTVSFVLIFALLGLLPIVILMATAMSDSLFISGSGLVISMAYVVLLGIVQSTLQAIYRAAVYCYARTGSAPRGFNDPMLANSFRRK